ncbi:hypothetical protein B0H14DRAFT_3047389 [Mycena olivaceomarginata]|nr:hypothetical protein B0H14DRAFT_3047389 [Mycena olivaceomarginata]
MQLVVQVGLGFASAWCQVVGTFERAYGGSKSSGGSRALSWCCRWSPEQRAAPVVICYAPAGRASAAWRREGVTGAQRDTTPPCGRRCC